ncbi:MAG TPA: hypothetical protein VK578_11875 [Edaphobacter sp.]|nr:hypothetical protein [Edaphobacter sp.]
MPSPKAARTTTRRLLTLASLGVAGLLAGLLSGCSPSPASSNLATYTQPRSFESLTRTHQPPSLYTHPLPDLKHPPTPHRIESWADRTPRQTSSPFSSQIDAGPTLSEYAFTGAPLPPRISARPD